MKLGKVLIVGGGIAGMSAAILLREQGTHVDLVEMDPEWRVYGAGITLSGPTLRAFQRVGVIDSIMAEGWCADGLDILSVTGQPLGSIPTPRIGRPDVPGAGGILRPVLARILRERTLTAGVAVRCGTSFSILDLAGPGAAVEFLDGRREHYDLVVGADGLHSKVRQTLFPGAPAPAYTGQVSWRAVVPRPESVARAFMMMGPGIKAGVNPISRHEMYLFVTEASESADFLPEADLPTRLREVLRPFGGVVGEIRDGLNEHSRIVYRPFFAMLAPAPWYRRSALIIGDAAHATTPHLASGAGIGVEDAVVLAAEIQKASTLEGALQSFMSRRFARCKAVVENSLRLGDLERSREEAAHGQLMRDSMQMLLAPV